MKKVIKEKKSDITKKKILDVGVKLWPNITARKIARELGMTHPIIAHYFGSDLLDAIAVHAVEKGKSRVIAQLIATKHPAVKNMGALERQKHMDAAS